MKRHGSMNHIFRLVWSQVLQAWVAVAETTRGRGKGGRRKLVAAALSLTASAMAMAGPEGGQVVAGTGSIAQSGATTTINQASQNLSLTWQRFNVAASETVNFVQPSASAIAVNRIFDTNGSTILGRLNANGQVYLINPNGILFGQGAQVNVGGLVASTLDFSDAALNSNTRTFSGTGSGSVLNQGTINAANGGYVALLGKQVSNQGSITAPQGTVALGAGSTTTLTFQGNSLVKMQIDQSVLDNLADNGGLIKADGGTVLMSAGAKDALLASVVNNSGVIEAKTVENKNGTIILLGGMKAGTTNVGGTLDASAPNGGNGGFIETSAAHVKIADDAKITTAATMGLNGTWLIDPVDFTIAATGGDMTGATLTTNLAGGNVVIQSTSGGAGTAGDVNVNDVVSWSANKLTLNAQNNINIRANLNASSTASLALEFGQSAVAAGNTSNVITSQGAAVNLPASTTNFTTKQGSNGVVKNYTVITSLGAAGSTTTTDLQGMNGNKTLNYALGGNIDASATSGWNAGAGYLTPGDNGTQFTGTFDGLGHTISNLFINRPTTNHVGLFGYSNGGATVRNVGMINVNITGQDRVAALIAQNNGGSISNSYSSGTVTGRNEVGGLVGLSAFNTPVSNSYSIATVSGDTNVGGLVGQIVANGGALSNSYATGTVTATSQNAGGLVGEIDGGGTVTNSYASGTVSAPDNAGGLVGRNYGGTATQSYATGSVSGTDYVGGLVGLNLGAGISSSYATGAISGSTYVGGLVGGNVGGTGGYGYGGAGSVGDASAISNSYATGTVSGSSKVGGLAGGNIGGNGGSAAASYGTPGTGGVGGAATISNSYSVGAVTGSSSVGGLLGRTGNGVNGSGYGGGSVGGAGGSASVGTSYWNTSTSGQGSSAGGTGLTSVQMQTASNFSGFNFTTTPGATGNNWVMVNVNGTLNNAGGALGATLPMLASEYSTTITNAHQLQLMRMNLAGSYTLGSDIDAAKTGTSTDVWGSTGFVPVGNHSAKFTGTFDGLNRTVSNLTINMPTTTNVALFGNTMSGAVISNVGLLGVDIQGQYAVGALVGIHDGTASINNSYSTGSVSGEVRVGGLVGGSYGTITNSHSSVNVTGTSNYTGGLVGRNYIAYGGSFSNNHATGNVSGNGTTGGLIGSNENSSTVSNSYATGNVTATGDGAGGLVGQNSNGSTLSNSYSTGNVTGATGVGGLVGKNDGALSNSHYDLHNVLVNGTADTYVTAGGLYTAQYQDWFSNSLTLNIANYSASLAGGGNNYTVNSVQGFKDMLGFAGNSAYTFTQTGNIDLSGQTNLHIPYLAAGFDGGGYSISNLNLTQSFGGSGLFSLVASGSTVSNVNLLNATVQGIGGIGGLAGRNDGTINNSTASGSVSGSYYGVGGLAGFNYGTISNSSSAVNITGTGSDVGGLVGRNMGTTTTSHATGNVTGDTHIGGLVGQNHGTVSYSYAATGTVNGTGSSVGGLVGWNNYGNISNSYASTAVTSTNGYVGGLVGFSYGGTATISNSYAIGSVSVTGGSNVGGLVGRNDYGSTVSNSYAAGAVSVTGGGTVGGLVGVNNGASVNTSFWDTTSSGQAGSNGGTGLTTAQMQSASNFAGFNFTTTPGATGNNWVMVGIDGSLNGIGGTLPMLASEYSTTINNAHQLQLMRMDLGANYTLGQNIDAAATGTVNNVWASGTFVPVGKDGARFTGTLDGLGYTISALNINMPDSGLSGFALTPTADEAGLFGHIGATGSVQNIGLVGGSVVGRDFVGALAGTNDGTITNSYASTAMQGRGYVGGLVGHNTSTGTTTGSHATGAVTGSDGTVGGLVGLNEGVVSNDYATGAVQGAGNGVGGLVGINQNAISNSYASGSVSGSNYVGGLVGTNYNNGSGISNSYATGSAQGNGYVGGLIGLSYGNASNSYATGLVSGAGATGGLIGSSYGTVTNSFWNIDTSGQATSSAGSGLTTQQMKQLSSFSSWNTATPNTIAATGNSGASWRIYEGHTAPLLTQFLTQLTRSDAVVTTYNGTAQGAAGGFPSGVLAATETNAGTYSAFYSNQQGYDISGGTLTINQANLTLATSNVTKTYDGGLTAAGTATITSGTLFGSDAISGGTFAYTDKNAGSGNKTVTTSGVTVTDGNSGGNYNVTYADNTTSTINQANLTLGGARAYDGTSAVAGSVLTATGVNSETFTVTGAGDTSNLASKNVQTASTLANVTGLTLGTSGNGGLSGNYNALSTTGSSVNITQASLTLATGNVTKTYDGSLTALGTAAVTSGTLFSTDSVSGGTFAFTDANVGSGNKTVTTSGVTVTDGNSGGNYNVTYANNNTSTISQANLTLATGNVTKTYDGTLAASGTATVTSGTLYNNASNGGALDSISGGSFAFTDANAGSGNKTVTTSGVTVTDGNSGGNYNVTYANNTTSTISQANLTLATGNVTKTYDGTLAAAGTATVTSGTLYNNASNGGTLDSISGGSFAFTDANAGSGNKTVSTSGVTVTDGNSGGNYNVTYANNTTSTISQANLTIASSNVSKTYDGTLTAAGTATVTSGTLYNNASNGGTLDSISGGTFAFTNANAGSGNKTVTTSGVTVTDGNSGGNYNVTYANNTTSTISQVNLTLATSNVTKTYDGTLTAAGTATVTSGTLYNNASNGGALDSISGGTFAFTNANAGSGNKTVTTTGVTVTDGNSGGNYNVTYANNTTSTISQANLTLATSNVTKTYDGTLTAAGTATVTSGTLYNNASNGGALDSISGGTFAFTNANAGSGNKTVTTTGVTVTDGNSGGNYNVTYAGNTTSTISQANLTLATSNVTKTYDGTLTAAGTAAVTSGSLFGSDAISGGTFAFIDKNVGAGNRTVTTTGVTVSDGNSGGNYNVTYADNTTSTISQANLTLSTSNVTKTYDGTLTAAGTAAVTSGSLFGSDAISGGTFAFTDKNVGSGNKTVTTSGVTVTDGNSGGNYNVTYANNTTSTISQANLTLATSNVTKTYDGTLAASGTATVTSGALFGSDAISGGTFAFTDKNVGAGNKTVTTTGVTVTDGNSGGNYNVTYADNTTSTISQANLTLATSNVTKTYDGTLTAAGTAAVTSGSLFGSDAISGGTFAFSDKNVGAGNKTVSTSGVTVTDGNSGGNYNVTYADNTTSTISQANLTLATSNVTKTYDGTLTAAGTATVTSGSLFGSDAISGGTFAFTDKNVGAGNKTVSTSGVTVTDGNSGGNYNVTYANNTTSAITAATLAVTGVTAANKPFDGTTAATLGGTAAVSAFNTDVVTVGGSGVGAFADPAVGTGKAVTVTGFTLGGADAGNYSVAQPSGLTADITEALPTTPPPLVQNAVGGLITTLLSNQGAGSGAATGSGSSTGSASGTGSGSGSTNGSGSGTGAGTGSDTGSGGDAGSSNGGNGSNANVTMQIGEQGATLKIENGGISLPNNMANDDEK